MEGEKNIENSVSVVWLDVLNTIFKSCCVDVVTASLQVDPWGLEMFFVAALFGCSEMSDALVGFSLHHFKENHLAD